MFINPGTTFRVVPKMGYLSECKGSDIILRDKEILAVHVDETKKVLFKLGNGIDKFDDLPYVTMFEAFKDGVMYVKSPQEFKYVKLDLFYHINKDKEESNG